MKVYDFEYNGKLYGAGTIITMKFYNGRLNRVEEKKVPFCYRTTIRDAYAIQLPNGNIREFLKENFYKDIISVEDTINSYVLQQAQTQLEKENRKPTFKDEMYIDGLFFAWIWYVFIMAVAVIFHARIGIWVIASILFFKYRKRKLREAGYNK